MFFFDWLLLGRVTGKQFLKPPSGSDVRDGTEVEAFSLLVKFYISPCFKS